MNFSSQIFFNDINHGYSAAILKKNFCGCFRFIWLWLLISIMKRSEEQCALQLYHTSSIGPLQSISCNRCFHLTFLVMSLMACFWKRVLIQVKVHWKNTTCNKVPKTVFTYDAVLFLSVLCILWTSGKWEPFFSGWSRGQNLKTLQSSTRNKYLDQMETDVSTLQYFLFIIVFLLKWDFLWNQFATQKIIVKYNFTHPPT